MLTCCFVRHFRTYETIYCPEGGSGMSLRDGACVSLLSLNSVLLNVARFPVNSASTIVIINFPTFNKRFNNFGLAALKYKMRTRFPLLIP